MLPLRHGNLYDYPKYYDLVFGSDWKAEFDFLTAAFAKFGKGKTRRLFEPGCGTGRLMYRFAKAGYEVAGNDLCEPAVKYCNARLLRHGFPATAVVEDMSDFKVRKKFDAAFNMINTFRHLPSEEHAQRHLECIADALRPGGLYLLGLHLTPSRGHSHSEQETWSARRGNLSVISKLWSMGLDRRKRSEPVGMSFDVYTPQESFRLGHVANFRTYTATQMADLVGRVPQLQIIETYDFAYCIDSPITIKSSTEDVVYVLRKEPAR